MLSITEFHNSRTNTKLAISTHFICNFFHSICITELYFKHHHYEREFRDFPLNFIYRQYYSFFHLFLTIPWNLKRLNYLQLCNIYIYKLFGLMSVTLCVLYLTVRSSTLHVASLTDVRTRVLPTRIQEQK